MVNSLYAQFWNLGQAPCPDTLDDFYWFNPALGFDAAHANLVGASWVELRARGEANSHRLGRWPGLLRGRVRDTGRKCIMVGLVTAGPQLLFRSHLGDTYPSNTTYRAN